MDETDRAIVNALQGGFPLAERPFALAAAPLGIGEDELIARIGAMLDDGTLTRFGPLFQIERSGGAFTLAAMQVPAHDVERVAGIVGSFPEVAHNYEREHALNLWFVVATESRESMAAALRAIEQAAGYEVLDFPKEREYFVELRLEA